MSKQSTYDLIVEARGVLSRPIRADHESEEARGVIQRLVYALEAAERRADTAREEVGYEKRMREFISGERDRFIDLKRAAEQGRNQLAAVVEKVRSWTERNKEVGYGTGTGASALEILDILATDPADVLREHDARIWDEGADATAEHIENGGECGLPNPYRREEQP